MILFISIWPLHLVPLLIIAGPIWFLGRKRVHWNGWDFAIAVIPFGVWCGLMLANSKDKSLSNLEEGFIIGCVAPVATIVRVIVADKLNQKAMAIGLLVLLCLVAAGLWALVPGWPE